LKQGRKTVQVDYKSEDGDITTINAKFGVAPPKSIMLDGREYFRGWSPPSMVLGESFKDGFQDGRVKFTRPPLESKYEFT
jgi:hypothetical protein